MDLAARILAVISTWPGAWYPPDAEPETPVEREKRYATIAVSIEEATNLATCHERGECDPIWIGSRDELAGVLATQGWWESRFAWHVHAGFCRLTIGECDAARTADGRLYARALSVFQLQQSLMVPTRVWKRIAGTSYAHTRLSAIAAARVLAHARRRCAKGEPTWWVSPTIAAYATGHTCHWSRAGVRARWYRLRWETANVVPNEGHVRAVQMASVSSGI